MKTKLSLVALVVSSMLFISCKDNKQKESKDVQKNDTEHVEKEVLKKDCNDVHWSHHEGEDGPKNWKNLCDGFSDCGGKAQSPINIVTKNSSNGTELMAPKFSYGKSKVDIINNSHTLQFNVSGENMVNLNGKDYKLLQFHYHALSEHTIDGKYFPLEVHFVHQHSDTDFAVLGVMFKEGEENELFKKYLDKFPTTKGAYESAETIDLLGLFPDDKSYYNYKGSLTTPPCSEVVNWFVLKTPVTASKEQIDQFSKLLNNNYRPIQALNDRTVLSYSK